VALIRLIGSYKNNFSRRSSKSSPAAENISLNGILGNFLNST